MYVKVSYTLGFVFCLSPCMGQGVVSRHSIGELGTFEQVVWPSAVGMASLGIAIRPRHSLSVLNPAMLGQESYVQLQLAGRSEWQKAYLNANSQNQTYYLPNGLALSMPLKAKYWGIAFGIAPYTQLNYRVLDSETLANNTRIRHRLTGQGGLYQAFLMQGITLTSNMRIGAGIAFVSGTTDKEDTQWTESPQRSLIHTRYRTHTFYQGLGFHIGWLYALNVSADKQISFGLSYQPSIRLRADERRSRQLYNLDEVPIQLPLNYQYRSYRQALPHRLSGGIGYQLKNTWRMGLEMQAQLSAEALTYMPWQLAYGLEWTPNPSSIHYFARTPVRLGISWSKTPYTFAEQALYAYALSVGTSLPLKGALSHLDFGLTGGQRRELNLNPNIREQYIQLAIGATFSNQWFIKRRFQ